MSFTERTAEKVAPSAVQVLLPVPAFSDLGKSANDVCELEYHTKSVRYEEECQLLMEG